MKFFKALSGADGASCAFAAILLLLVGCVGSTLASAQWTVANTETAWSAYQSHFQCNNSQGHNIFAAVSGTCSPTGFWTEAELIEMAVDGTVWAQTNDSSELVYFKDEVNSLCSGFEDQHGTDWSSDKYDDDLMWATIAFLRAYIVTGNSAWLGPAETNFQTVYNRGLASNGGIYWYSGCESGCSSWYEKSPANWTFVIAGYGLSSYSGNSTYKNEAAGVYNWAIANLYNSSTGEIYDGVNSNGQTTGEYSYNYGIAIGAVQDASGSKSIIGNIANYLMYDLPNYAGTVGGYNILPNYGQGNQDGSGFNGIALRWVGNANAHGNVSSAVVAWARTNVTQAWAERNTSTNLIWNDWMSPTTGTEYAWDESDAVVGMLDIPD